MTPDFLARYIGAFMGTDVSVSQAQALMDATTCEEVVQAFRAMPRPIVHAPILPRPERTALPDLTDYGCTDARWSDGQERLDSRALGADHG